MEKFLIEVKNIPTEAKSKAFYEKIRVFGAVNMFYTGTNAFIYGELEPGTITRIEDIITDEGYEYYIDRG